MLKRIRLSSKFSHIAFSFNRLHTSVEEDTKLINRVCAVLRRSRTWDAVTTQLHSLNLNNSILHNVLLRLKDPLDAKRALSFFHWSARRAKNFQPDIRSYCITVQILVRARLLIDARVLLESVVKRVAETGELGEFVIVDCMLSMYESTESSPFLFDFVIQTYAKLRMFEVAFSRCLYLEERGFFASLISFNKLMYLAEKDGERKLVWKVYEHMLVRRIYPNEVTVRILVSAMCKEGILQKFVDLLERIHGKKCVPMVVVNVCLVFKIFEDGRTEDGILLLKRMLQKNMVLDDVVYSLIICAHCRNGNLDEVRESYEDMLRKGYCANAFLYTLFIGIHCKEGRINEACRLMQEMKDENLRPFEETYNCLIQGCCKVGNIDLSLMWYEEMLSDGLLPNLFACNEMLRGLCENGDVKKANNILTVLLNKGFHPDETTYCYIMDGYGKDGNIHEVLKLYYEAEYAGPSPGLMTYMCLIKSLCKSGKLKEADKYLSIMYERNLVLSSSLYNVLIQRHCEDGNFERAFCLYDEMLSKDFKPDSHTVAILREKINNWKSYNVLKMCKADEFINLRGRTMLLDPSII